MDYKKGAMDFLFVNNYSIHNTLLFVDQVTHVAKLHYIYELYFTLHEPVNSICYNEKTFYSIEIIIHFDYKLNACFHRISYRRNSEIITFSTINYIKMEKFMYNIKLRFTNSCNNLLYSKFQV